MVKAVIEQSHYQTRLIAGNHHEIIVDEPVSNGGQGLGVTPSDLLAGALASCTSITLRMYSDRKQWDTGTIEVSVSIEKEIHIDTTRFERKISFTGNLSEEQKAKLLEIADHCPLHKMLTKANLVNTTI